MQDALQVGPDGSASSPKVRQSFASQKFARYVVVLLIFNIPAGVRMTASNLVEKDTGSMLPHKLHGHGQLSFASVVIVAPSAAGWGDRRARIRAQLPRNLRLIPDTEQQPVVFKFAVGNLGLSEEALAEMASEAKQHQDILMLACLDEDVALRDPAKWSVGAGASATTSKVLLSVTWAIRHYDFDYFFRLGDDSYFRIDKFVSMISDQQIPLKSAVVGRILHAEMFGDWQAYPQGMGYGLTYDVCAFIARNSHQLMDTAPEDCIVARWLMAIGTKFIDYLSWRDIGYGERCQPDMVLAHKLPPELWSNITDSGTVEC